MEATPRGPLVLEQEGNAPDYPEHYNRRMQEWRESAKAEAEKFHRLSPEFERTKTYIDFVEGKQWSAPRARYKSRFYYNKTGKARIDSIALLTDSRPDVSVASNLKSETMDHVADIVDRVIRAEWIRSDMDLNLITAVDISNLMGTSFAKLSARRPGMMRMLPCGPDSVMPIQPGFHIQESSAVRYRTWAGLARAMQDNPYYADEIKRRATMPDVSMSRPMIVRPLDIHQHVWDRLSPQMQHWKSLGAVQDPAPRQASAFQSVESEEYFVDDITRNESTKRVLVKAPLLSTNDHNWWEWVEPGGFLYPRKRLIKFVGGVCVYDGPSPYWHGLYPFACLRTNPVFWSFWGLSKYRDLLPLNSAINDIVAGVLDTIKKALNQPMLGKGIPKPAWDEFFPDMPGARLLVNNSMFNPQADVRYLEPPNLPGYVFQVLEWLSNEFDKQAGIIDVAALGRKAQVPGGDTLEQMRDSLQTALRLEGRYIETFLRDCGIQAVANVFQFYSKAQRMRLIGEDGISFTDFDFDPNMLTPYNEQNYEFWKNFEFSVVPGSLHGGAKDRRKLMMMNMYQMGAISLPKLLGEMDIGNVETIMSQLEAEAPLRQQLAGGSKARMSRGQRNGAAV